MYTTFSVADPKTEPLLFHFTLHAKHLYIYIIVKHLLYVFIVIPMFLCKMLAFLNNLLPLPATSHPKTAG